MNSRNRTLRIHSGFSPSMIDVFAILLMIIGSQNQFYFDSAPVVAHEQTESSQPTPHHPLVVELSQTGPLVEGKSIDWPQLEARFTQLDATGQIIVRATCDDRGQGPLSNLMQLGFIAQRAKVADRLLLDHLITACQQAPQKFRELHDYCRDLDDKIAIAKDMKSWTGELSELGTTDPAFEDLRTELGKISSKIDGELAGLSTLMTIKQGTPEIAPATEDLITRITRSLDDSPSDRVLTASR